MELHEDRELTSASLLTAADVVLMLSSPWPHDIIDCVDLTSSFENLFFNKIELTVNDL